MNVGDYLKKKKDPKGYMERRAHELLRELEDFLAQYKPVIESEASKVTTLRTDAEQLRAHLVALEPKLLDFITEHIPAPIKGEDGKDYTLTDADKSEIAASITVPVVEKVIEKRQVINQPIIKEVAVPEELSPTTIVERINTTKNSIAMSVISGLLEELASLKREIRKKTDKGGGGGGGMGDVQHETKALSSSTTTVTTAYPIAAGGYAIMGAYYQSALIMLGEHYTVGADRKTITLLFTPENSTKLDIIYVR